MLEILDELNITIISFLKNAGMLAPLLACILIVIESIIPILPLFVFIAINFLVFGKFMGFIISWFFTVVGCMLSFYIFRKGLRNFYIKKIEKSKYLKKQYGFIKKLKLEHLTLLMAMPFTPAFLLNVFAGLGEIKSSKFLLSTLIGKISMVYFWGFIGVSFIESLKNPYIMIKIGILLLISYIISKLTSIIINKSFDKKNPIN